MAAYTTTTTAAATTLVDCLIVGGGPAGLSAALTLGRLHRSCIIFDDSVYRNERAHRAHGILTRDHVAPSEIRRLGREDLQRYGNTRFVNDRIEHIRKPAGGEGDGAAVGREKFFTAVDAKGKEYSGRTVVLATGAKDKFPDLPGYAENWGTSIYQCPVCDGHERSHLPAGIWAYPSLTPQVFKMSTMLHNLSKRVGQSAAEVLDPKAEIPRSKITLFANGPVDETQAQMAKGMETMRAHGISVNTQPVVGFSEVKDGEGIAVHLKDGSSVELGYLFHKPSLGLTVPNLISELGLKTSAAPFGQTIVSSPPFNTAVSDTDTPINGVFVAGDNSVAMASVTAAMLSGTLAGAGVAHHCNELDDQKALARWKGRVVSSKDTVDVDPALPDDTGCITTAVQQLGAASS